MEAVAPNAFFTGEVILKLPMLHTPTAVSLGSIRSRLHRPPESVGHSALEHSASVFEAG